jgi:predicted DNA-binding transcriptional regulator AlpA
MKTYQKQDVIDELKNEVTIKGVCGKLGISRQTIYRWIEEDEEFAEKLKISRKEAIYEMNDECENKVIQKIRSDDSGMIKFWLRYHHDDYKQSYIITK